MSGGWVTGGEEKRPRCFSSSPSSPLPPSLMRRLCGSSGACFSCLVAPQRQRQPHVAPPCPLGNVSVVSEVSVTSIRVGRAPGTSLWDSKAPRSAPDSFTHSNIPLPTYWEPSNPLGARITSLDKANGTCLREPYPHSTLIGSTGQAQIWEYGLPGTQPPSKNGSTCKTTFPFEEVGSRRPTGHSFQQGV